MPQLQISFTGLCLFIRHKQDAQVDVRFVTKTSHEHMAPHLPIMHVPSDVWRKTIADDGNEHAGRGAGRPIHLYLEDLVEIRPDGSDLTGSVNVIDSGGTSSVRPADWNDMKYVLRAADVFPGANFDSAAAAAAAPFGLMELKGGVLSGALPTTQTGDFPWDWFRPDGTPLNKRTYLTDKTTFTVPFQKTVEIRRTERDDKSVVVAESTITLASDTDIIVWVAHDPFSLDRKGGHPDVIEMEHLELFRACFPNAVAPPRVRSQSGMALSPKHGSCGSLQVSL